MATIELSPDNLDSHVRWMKWVERGEIIGRIARDFSGRCYVSPQGPHWSPMKSFAGASFDSPESALAEVERYFRGR
jgi:hypothetical protein